ncbi:MAG: hypothetical protein HC903_24330 [Methylacidiphilales bacterium]|nr:hypothetical protein [Candidatus Methylacidiphilales bacterium]NJR16216.1 hypothetical protein [Calothrix sp. CSU_2_0]
MTSIKFFNLNIADEEQLCSITDEESLSINGGFLFPPVIPDSFFRRIRDLYPWITPPRPRIPHILPKC